ncbi:MAG: hypothetical protein BGO43_12125 [Gammaproteobacteria bacterium 39-13]|nr:hypothetical protein [Gammaproteobacteria bacterium]OJV86207.1 MAG: hypothetical protein BGO43_12125 [Gammaproteobacteria bacterium 39-13]
MRALALTTVYKIKNPPQYHIAYENRKVFDEGVEGLPRQITIDTLLFTGGHGNFHTNPKKLNEIDAPRIDAFCQRLQRINNGTIRNIVIDCCDSACFIPNFKSLLADDGVIYCNLSDGRQHNIVEIFKNFKNYQSVTLGIALFNLISIMMDNDKCIGDDVLSYPAIYTKKNNTLYYYGDANDGLINELKKDGVKIVKITNQNEYLDKLLYSEMPLTEGQDKITDDRLADWQNLRNRGTKKALADNDVEMKLLKLCKTFFPKNEKISIEDYVRNLFPLAKRYAKNGTDPIRLLANVLCKHKLNRLDDKEQKKNYALIGHILHKEFALTLLRSEWNTIVTQSQASLTLAEFAQARAKLRKRGLTILGEEHEKEVNGILETVIAELPLRHLRMGYWPAGRSLMVGIGVGIAIAFLPALGVTMSLSWTGIGIISALVSSGMQLSEFLKFQLKTNTLAKYKSATKITSLLSQKERLEAFLDGAQNTYQQQIRSCISYRDWRYMQDYYAGQCANETQDRQLIEWVGKKLRKR